MAGGGPLTKDNPFHVPEIPSSDGQDPQRPSSPFVNPFAVPGSTTDDAQTSEHDRPAEDHNTSTPPTSPGQTHGQDVRQDPAPQEPHHQGSTPPPFVNPFAVPGVTGGSQDPAPRPQTPDHDSSVRQVPAGDDDSSGPVRHGNGPQVPTPRMGETSSAHNGVEGRPSGGAVHGDRPASASMPMPGAPIDPSRRSSDVGASMSMPSPGGTTTPSHAPLDAPAHTSSGGGRTDPPSPSSSASSPSMSAVNADVNGVKSGPGSASNGGGGESNSGDGLHMDAGSMVDGRTTDGGVFPANDPSSGGAAGSVRRRGKTKRSSMDYSGFLDEDAIDDDDPFGIGDYDPSDGDGGWSDGLDEDPVDWSEEDSDAIGASFLDSGDDGRDDPFGIGGTTPKEHDRSRSHEINTDDGDLPLASERSSGSTVSSDAGAAVDLDLDSHDVKMRSDRSRIDVDALTARSRVAVEGSGQEYPVNQTKLREGVQIGAAKRELSDFIHNPKIVDEAITRQIQLLEFKKRKRIPFTRKIPLLLDFLSRFRIATTLQLARIAGWKDTNESRLVKKLRVYDEVGWLRESVQYAGPRVWTDKDAGARMGMHPWLDGIRPGEINPQSQNHTFGLSSIASWLLCPWDDSPNVLGMDPGEWTQVRREIQSGEAYLLAEREYRAPWSAIRRSGKGLLPPEYRHGFIGYNNGQLNPVSGAWQEWALAYKNGDAGLDESPELLACNPEFMGEDLWMWVIWGNSVWNPKVLEDRAMMEEGIDLDDPEWSGRDGEFRLKSEFRRLGYVDVEERLDYATNKPMLNKELGDRVVLWDHLPDMIIARRRTDDQYADPQSIAIELELTPKQAPDAYLRTMAAYGSPLGQTLYQRVIWVVSSGTIAKKIRAGADKVGMVLGEDYDIVPFVTSAHDAFYVRKSFYSGADILPGRWNKRGLIEPAGVNRSIPLS